MFRFTLPVCLVFALAAAVAPAATKAQGTQALSPDEKLALACLGRIGAQATSAADRAKAREARRLFATLPTEATLRPLVQALRCEPAPLRIFAADALARSDEPSAVRPLLSRVVREKDASVRRALIAAVRRMDAPDAVHVLGRALRSRYALFRERAAEALVGLGDELAYPYLIRLWEGRSGDFPRSYFAQVTQHAYLADFDVEVA